MSTDQSADQSAEQSAEQGAEQSAEQGDADQADAQRYEQPLVSVDVVPLWAAADGTLHVTLGRRLNEPFRGELALPGVLMGRERSVEAAARALRTKVGVEPGTVVLRDIGVFDSHERDPRGPTMAVAKAGFGLQRDLLGGELPDVGLPGAGPSGAGSSDAGPSGAGLGAGHAEAAPVAELPALPFDHASIIGAACRALARSLWTDREVCAALLGPEFTTRTATAVQRQLEAFGGQEARADASNMKRRLQVLGWVTPTERTELPDGATGRPSTVWVWT